MNFYLNFAPLLGVAVLHAVQAGMFWFSGDRPAFVTLLGFTLSDIGLVWALAR